MGNGDKVGAASVGLVLLLLFAGLSGLQAAKPKRGIIVLAPTTALHVDGKYIKNAAGDIVYLRGFSVDSGFYSGGLADFETWGYYDSSKIDLFFSNLADKGVTLIRCMTQAKAWVDDSAVTSDIAGLTYQDMIIDFCTRAALEGIYVIMQDYTVMATAGSPDSDRCGYNGYAIPSGGYSDGVDETGYFATRAAFVSYVVNRVLTITAAVNNFIPEIWAEPYGWNNTELLEWQTTWNLIIAGLRSGGYTGLVNCHHSTSLATWGTYTDYYRNLNWTMQASGSSLYELTDSEDNLIVSFHMYREWMVGDGYPEESIPYTYAAMKAFYETMNLDHVAAARPVFGSIGTRKQYPRDTEYLRNSLTIFNEWGIHYAGFELENEDSQEYSLLVAGTEKSALTFNTNGQIIVDAIASGTPDPPFTGGSTAASTELIDYSTFSSLQCDQWVALCKAQGMSEFTLRIPAYSDWSDGVLSSTYETVSKTLIGKALAKGINVNIDLHTWYTTWDSYFDSSASGAAANRVTYLAYVADAVAKLDVAGVKAFMVLNEPQAQTAVAAENTFILDCISTAQAITSKPVSVRFMMGYSPSTGHYDSAIDTASDFLCRNTYWDPRTPSVSVYGTTEAKMNAFIALGASTGKELWITEFGKSKSNLETQRAYVEAFVSYAASKEIERVFCWVSQPVGGSAENYNVFSGWTPNPAWYELGGQAEPPDEPEPPQPVTYNLVIYYSSGGSTIPAAGIISGIPLNEGFSVEAVAASGYIWDYWILDGNLSNLIRSNPVNVTMNMNHTLQPTFKPEPTVGQYLLTIHPALGGSTNPEAGTHLYNDGDVAVVSFTALSGYTHTKTVVDGTEYTAVSPLSIIMNANHTVYPVFTWTEPSETPEETPLPVQGQGNTATSLPSSEVYDKALATLSLSDGVTYDEVKAELDKATMLGYDEIWERLKKVKF